jgi:BirA family transcriptional regulator, biotin operon repressor / biotin---[acetyl-CoA-carboxylase] ligase
MRPLKPRPPSPSLAGPLVHLDVVGSTNDCARELALAGTQHGTVVVAEEQTAGRGRQGRRWSAPRGRALTLSVVVEAGRADHPGTGGIALLPLVAGLAVCEACEAVAPIRCRIKWPNDVWIGDRKLAGILIEARPHEGWAVIGVGINVDTAEDELGPELLETATSLRIATGAPTRRDAVLDALLDRLGGRLDELWRGGTQAIVAACRERDALLGRRIAWTGGGKETEGEAQGLDERGNLVVLTDAGERLALEAGEVHLSPGGGEGRPPGRLGSERGDSSA